MLKRNARVAVLVFIAALLTAGSAHAFGSTLDPMGLAAWLASLFGGG